MSHKAKYQIVGKPPLQKHQARCRCPWTSDRLPSKQEAEDAFLAHLRDVERLKAGLGTRTPSMKGQAAYYRERANDPETPEGDRPIWVQLADELEHRLGHAPSDDEQPTLL